MREGCVRAGAVAQQALALARLLCVLRCRSAMRLDVRSRYRFQPRSLTQLLSSMRWDVSGVRQDEVGAS